MRPCKKLVRNGHNWESVWHWKLILRTGQRSFCRYIYTFRGVYIRLYFISDGDSVGGRSCCLQYFRLAPRTVIRTNIKWLKNEGPTKIVSSSVTENRTGTLGLNRRSAYKLSAYQGGGSRWPTRWIWTIAAIQAAGGHCWLSDVDRTFSVGLGHFRLPWDIFVPNQPNALAPTVSAYIVTTAIGYRY